MLTLPPCQCCEWCIIAIAFFWYINRICELMLMEDYDWEYRLKFMVEAEFTQEFSMCLKRRRHSNVCNTHRNVVGGSWVFWTWILFTQLFMLKILKTYFYKEGNSLTSLSLQMRSWDSETLYNVPNVSQLATEIVVLKSLSDSILPISWTFSCPYHTEHVLCFSSAPSAVSLRSPFLQLPLCGPCFWVLPEGLPTSRDTCKPQHPENSDWTSNGHMSQWDQSIIFKGLMSVMEKRKDFSHGSITYKYHITWRCHLSTLERACWEWSQFKGKQNRKFKEAEDTNWPFGFTSTWS